MDLTNAAGPERLTHMTFRRSCATEVLAPQQPGAEALEQTGVEIEIVTPCRAERESHLSTRRSTTTGWREMRRACCSICRDIASSRRSSCPDERRQVTVEAVACSYSDDHRYGLPMAGITNRLASLTTPPRPASDSKINLF